MIGRICFLVHVIYSAVHVSCRKITYTNELTLATKLNLFGDLWDGEQGIVGFIAISTIFSMYDILFHVRSSLDRVYLTFLCFVFQS